ncbi:MAG: hypothetical protein KKB04_00995 [Candidatus Thermoplasmatota archaeon]|nr:hypothetical protein [Candidatus Thermoplasmatota archaeon]
MSESKQSVLVLCHTIFHNAFRTEKYREINTQKFKKWLQSKFIADFIIEIGSELSEGNYFAFTSEKIFKEFSEQLEKECTHPEVYEHLNILRKLIFCVPNESVNKLEVNGGIIVIADVLSNRNDYEPVLITDMKDKKVEFAKEYYKKSITHEDFKIPFSILNLEETISFLKGRYPVQYELVKKRGTLYGII